MTYIRQENILIDFFEHSGPENHPIIIIVIIIAIIIVAGRRSL